MMLKIGCAANPRRHGRERRNALGGRKERRALPQINSWRTTASHPQHRYAVQKGERVRKARKRSALLTSY